jgi:diguanylate cyclase (GGDEF)-like protein
MAGALREFEAGEVLFRKGDPSDYMYAVLSGKMDVVDPIFSEDSDPKSGMHRHINRLGEGELLGEMGFLRDVPRSATVICAEPGELLQVNWKMIKRLQWLFPPTAQKFFFNLMTVVCDRLERSTDRLTEVSRVDDLTGLVNKRGFVEILEREVHRAKRYEANLSLCLMRMDLESANPEMSYDDRDRMIKYLAGILTDHVRKSDTLGRVDTHMFGLVLPHISAPEAQQICERLWHSFEEETKGAAANQVKVFLSLVELSIKEDETDTDFLGRATLELLKAMESGECRTLAIPGSE